MQVIVFFTRCVSLKTWDDVGLFEREVALYRCLRPNLRGIIFVTYGDAQDLHYEDRLDGIGVICNRWNLPERFYIPLISRVYPLSWRGNVVLRSNQVPGAEIASRAAQFYGKKFIARCGYLPSNIAMWRHGVESAEARRAKQLEAAVFLSADRVVVTTSALKQTIVERYGIAKDRVRIIPNYVDTRRFGPSTNSRQHNLLLFVGRLGKEKNIQALFEAVEGLDVQMAVIGDGSLKEALMARTEKDRLRVQFLGNVPNAELPAHLNQASVFVLPSHIEHHPKALIEAMACGLPVIGTNVSGIRELIVHGETGYLCDTSPEGIRAAIEDVLADVDLRARMGRNAREFVVEHFSLEKIVALELDLLQELLE